MSTLTTATFDCTKALGLLSRPCDTEVDAMLRVIAVEPMLGLVKALLEQAYGASTVKSDTLAAALQAASNALDELPNVDGWQELVDIERLTGEAA